MWWWCFRTNCNNFQVIIFWGKLSGLQKLHKLSYNYLHISFSDLSRHHHHQCCKNMYVCSTYWYVFYVNWTLTVFIYIFVLFFTALIKPKSLYVNVCRYVCESFGDRKFFPRNLWLNEFNYRHNCQFKKKVHFIFPYKSWFCRIAAYTLRLLIQHYLNLISSD